MCKEHTLRISTNLSTNHPIFLIQKRRSADVPVQNSITNFWKVTFSTYGSVCLEFFRTVTFETVLKNKAAVQFS